MSEYEAGFSTADEGCHVTVRKRPELSAVDLHLTIFGNGIGSASIHHRLEPGEARELALALGQAADAAGSTGFISTAAVSG